MKKFFNITSSTYIYDYNDIRSALTFINVLLIIFFGLAVAPFGLGLAIFNFIRDLIREEQKINMFTSSVSMIILNLYFVFSM
jgi:hypothetical protein